MAEVLERREDLKDPSPMMKQYLQIKNEYFDHVLMYRLGDFFECFFEDAVTVSREVGLTLTGRDCGEGRRAAMCGVPFHKSDDYIAKLVELGHKVAICEQTEDPATAKGIVERKVIRVVTPGTVTDADVLNDGTNNYLAAFCFREGEIGVSFADISTGQIYATDLLGEDRLLRLANEIAVYAPREVLLNLPAAECRETVTLLRERYHPMIEENREALFDPKRAYAEAHACFADRVAELSREPMLAAVGALLSYIRQTQKCDPTFVRELAVYDGSRYMQLDYATRRNLELTEAMHGKDKKGSLLWVLDKTKTAMGSRLLRARILQPLLSVNEIRERQGMVADFAGDYLLRAELREILDRVPDLERLTARVVYGSANARDLRAIASGIERLPDFLSLLSGCAGAGVAALKEGFDPLDDLYGLLNAALKDDPPHTVREAGMIRDGYDPDVDYLRSVRENGKGWIEEIEARERELTGIKSLRVGYNRVFGYYIEVSRSNLELVPDRYIRKQTLTGAERYITEQLKDMESTVLGAADKLCALEYEIFTALRNKTAAMAERIQETAARIAALDVALSLAEVAVKNNYVCPEVERSGELTIRDGRHPVVEKFVKDSYFVPNDTKLNTEGDRLYLITGPNMAGKSTYMRQVALITLMAQIGSFVPAKEATVGIADKIFTRVGASDDLASGQSTFMLEMNEVANILAHATPASLIVYDEVGRGTSTYDGMSIARAVVEYTHQRIGARTLFATHYHELTGMEQEFPGIVNYNVAAKKRGDDIVFLRKIVRGATDDSYGIEVAKLAGVPREVIRRAGQILASIEAGGGIEPPKKAKKQEEQDGLDLFAAVRDSEAADVADRVRAVDLNTLTPIEAMNLLFELKKILKSN